MKQGSEYKIEIQCIKKTENLMDHRRARRRKKKIGYSEEGKKNDKGKCEGKFTKEFGKYKEKRKIINLP